MKQLITLLIAISLTATQAFADGVEGTPTILVDGRPFEGDPYRPGSLAEAVEQAAP